MDCVRNTSPNPNPTSSSAQSYTQILQSQQVTYANFSYPQSTRPNSDPQLPYSALTSEPPLYPPGTDPHATLGSYESSHGGLEGQSTFSPDPKAVPQNWVVTQADPTIYAPAIKSLGETSVASTSSNPMWNDRWMNQPLANYVMNDTAKPSEVIQFIQCEVCNIYCNNKDALQKHMLGKKHNRNLQKQNASTSLVLNTYGTLQNGSLGQAILGDSSVSLGDELETKKQKLMEAGVSLDSVIFCTICSVACNSQVVFNKHVAGRKHAAKATTRLLAGDGPFVAANPNLISLISPTVQPHNNGTQKRERKKALVQPAWCEVCKINCNSYDVLRVHKLGKKHLKNLEGSKNIVDTPASTAQPATTPAVEPMASTAQQATTPVIGPMENPESSKSETLDIKKLKRKSTKTQASAEDLDTKRLKIMESGGAADAVQMCTLCNVVCNSKTVLDSHLAGQKHAAMVKKQAEAELTLPGTQAVTAA